MREHPIPQDITGYRFHIVGSMTLKQFGELLIGVILALIFYKTNLIFPIKWLLIIVSCGLGAAMAFLPIAERPLDHWITTFFKALYKPTQFYWKKVAAIPEPFLYEALATTTVQAPEIDLSPVRRTRIKEYLHSVNTPVVDNTDVLGQSERINQILETFKTQPVVSVAKKRHIEHKPDLSVRVRKLRTDTILPPRKEVTVFESVEQKSALISADPTSYIERGDKDKALLSTDQVAEQISIPQTEQLRNITAEHNEDGEELVLPQHSLSPDETVYVAQNNTNQVIQNTSQAAFNTNLPFPTPPDIPNKLVGMVLTPNNELVTSAIVEIHDKAGAILRAVKTNALGQFYITTPLENGDYSILVEKDGYSFQPLTLQLVGDIVPPVEVRSI